jgi:predicted dehydrogenase
MIGVTGMDLPRRPYYQKELTFVVSRSYGPGRYDRQYEEYGHDYPVGHVRWTEQRNIEAFLDLAAAGAIQPERCTTHRISIDDALQAFELVLHGREPSLGVVLTYPGALEPPREAETAERIALRKPTMRRPSGKAGISLIGAGNFARSVHLPNLCKMREVELRGVCDASGVVAASTGKKFGFAYCASVETELCEDPETDLVIIATSHSGHAGAVCRALAAGKAVFVEKPLAITFEQLWQVREVITASSGRLMVGFNRRFSPLAVELKDFIGNRGPILAQYRCNAGPLPAEHWMAEPAEGGRILGEACHFLDFFAFLTGAEPQRVYAAGPLAGRDDSLITVTYSDGSVCQLAYVSMGPSAYSKERVEVFASGRAGVIDDFWRLELYDDGGRRRRRRLLKANKGHFEELNACVAAVRSGGDMPIAWKSLFETTLASLAAVRSSQLGRPVLIGKLKPPGKPESEGCNAPIPIR